LLDEIPDMLSEGENLPSAEIQGKVSQEDPHKISTISISSIIKESCHNFKMPIITCNLERGLPLLSDESVIPERKEDRTVLQEFMLFR
jgi:hypothetical protein